MSGRSMFPGSRLFTCLKYYESSYEDVICLIVVFIVFETEIAGQIYDNLW